MNEEKVIMCSDGMKQPNKDSQNIEQLKEELKNIGKKLDKMLRLQRKLYNHNSSNTRKQSRCRK